MKKRTILFLLILIIGGIFAYLSWQDMSFSKEVLKIEILASEKANVGEEIEYIVKIKNNGNIRLENMVRVKRGVATNKRRKKVIKEAKGYKWSRKSKYVAAKQALLKAWTYAYRDRKVKKRAKRQLWQVQINAICRQNGTTYSKFIAGLRKNAIEVDRKILSQLAKENSDLFIKILEKAKS
jgi:large subunit ribosomal protein L20